MNTISHRLLISLLDGHVPSDVKEQADLRAMREYALALSDPFSRAQPIAHFTGSAVVVLNDGEKICLIHHRNLRRWLQPGGHAETCDGGDMAATALREVYEETGLLVRLFPNAPAPLDVDMHLIPARKEHPEHCHLDIRFLAVVEQGAIVRHNSDEVNSAAWFTWDEAFARTDESSSRRLLNKALLVIKASRW